MFTGGGAMLGRIALVINLLSHRVTRMAIGVLVDRPGSEEQRSREHARDNRRTPALLVRIVRGTHEDTLTDSAPDGGRRGDSEGKGAGNGTLDLTGESPEILSGESTQTPVILPPSARYRVTGPPAAPG